MFCRLPLALLLLAAPPSPSIRLSADGTAVEVAGVTTPDAGQLRVVVAEGSAADIAARPPIPGSTKLVAGVLRFTPRFPLTPGVKYRATYGGASADLTVPKPKREPTTVLTQVYPTANTLPENTLRLYLYFSAPMTRGGVYKYIKLLSADGRPVAYPFLELGEELWSADGKRFTLLFDPGRVKRGLKPREEAGPALEEGKKYTLVIDRAWADENGTPLKAPFRKSFSVGPPDDTPIDPVKWQITPPAPSQPLVVKLDKPLDRALLQRLVWVVGPDGKRINGTIAVSAGERQWSFTPRGPWKAGDYRLVIDTRLEDPCGNRVGQPFEIDVFKPVQKTIDAKTVECRFTVK
jgi:hypothetical protein